MQDAEDDGAGNTKYKHQQALAKEPLAHLELGGMQRPVETGALAAGEKRKEKVVGVFAFQHEVDTKECGGEDVEDVGEPERQ